MKRIRIVGLCLVAVFAFGALYAGAAQASSPEYGQCLPGKKAEYSNASCTVKSVKPKKGKFEWHPGPAPSCVAQKKGEYTNNSCTVKSVKPKKGKFEKKPGPGFTASGGTATLSTPALGGPVVCATNATVGTITGVKTDSDVATFTGCETAGKKCKSAGEPSGTITTFALATELTEPIPGEVNDKFTAVGGPTNFQAEFECEGVQIRTKGFVSGTVTPTNVMTLTQKAAFGVGKGEQALETEANVGAGFIGPFASTETTEATVTNASESETRS